MDRRELIVGGAMASAGLVATQAFGNAGSKKVAMNHGELRKAASECIESGETCVNHCLNLLKKGNTMLAECLASVEEMISIVQATRELAAVDSKLLAAQAKVCRDACLICEKECLKHKSHHKECAACAVACKTCADACKKVM